MATEGYPVGLRSESHARTIGILLVSLGGTIVGAVALTHALGPDEPTTGVALSVFVIFATTLPSYGIGAWLLRSTYTTREVYRVLAWALLGGIPLAVLMWIIASYQQSHGVVIHDLSFVMATVAGVGLVGGSLTGIHDIERAKREREYHTIDDQFTTVIEAAPVGIIAVDDDYAVQLWNQAATDLLGYEREAVLGEPCPVTPTGSAAPSYCFTATNTPLAFECERADGSRIAVECRTAELAGTNTDSSWHIAIISDVTEENRRRQRLAVLHRVLRHNLRTGVNVSQGHATLLAEAAETKQQSRSADAILKVADDLLALSDKAGRVERTLREIGGSTGSLDLVELAKRRTRIAGEDYPEAEISLDAPTEAWVHAGLGVGTAIMESIENAIQHNDSDTPIVDVTITPDQAADMVTLTVADNGPGIPRTERTAIEAGQETQTQHVTGLGLWLLSWIVKGSGGTLEFARNEPRGTSVRMTFPATAEQQAQPPDTGGSGKTRADSDPSPWPPVESYPTDLPYS